MIVSYFQGGRICDFINEKWGWDKLLAMIHDFGDNMTTVAVVEKDQRDRRAGRTAGSQVASSGYRVADPVDAGHSTRSGARFLLVNPDSGHETQYWSVRSRAVPGWIITRYRLRDLL